MARRKSSRSAKSSARKAQKPAAKAVEAPKAPEEEPPKTLAEEPLIVQETITESAPEPQQIQEPSVFVQESSEEQAAFPVAGEKTIVFDEREKLITTFTAGGVVLSFGFSIGSVLVLPAGANVAGLFATLGVISCFGAFMARESI